MLSADMVLTQRFGKLLPALAMCLLIAVLVSFQFLPSGITPWKGRQIPLTLV